jgi:AraC-like DNA-binding protein
MSRSGFAARFTELIGEPAMAYVARWRMFRASALIESGEHNVAGAGRAVGYDSEAAFSRAFKRIMGVPPSAVGRAV